MQKDDLFYLSLLQQGKEDALTYWVNIYFPILCSYANKIIDDEAQAEDLTEDLFIKLWEKRLSFASINELKSFLYTSIRNASLNVIRQRQREKKRHTFFSQQNSLDTDNGFWEEEVLAEIRKSIYELPPQMRKIFILSFFEKKTNDEIAETLNITNQTVRNQKSNALTILRKLLREKAFLVLFSYLI